MRLCIWRWGLMAAVGLAFAQYPPGNANGNRAQANPFKVIMEGQDFTASNDTDWTSTVSQAWVEMIIEFSLQTSNYAAEFGQVARVSSTPSPALAPMPSTAPSPTSAPPAASMMLAVPSAAPSTLPISTAAVTRPSSF